MCLGVCLRNTVFLSGCLFVMINLFASYCIISVQWHIFVDVLHNVGADRSYLKMSSALLISLPFFLTLCSFPFNCLSSHTSILSSLPCFHSLQPFCYHCQEIFPSNTFLPFPPPSLLHIRPSLASSLTLPCLRVWWRLHPQRVVKTPSAARAVPVCPASTGTPKRPSPRCNLESPMGVKAMPCPPHVYG